MKTNKLFFIFAILGVLSTACQKEPNASIGADRTETEVGQSINFTNTTVDGHSYEWDFGDGTSSNVKEPSKVYTASGAYTVKMTASSKNGKKTNQASLSVNILRPNAKFIGNYIGTFTGNPNPTSLLITAGSNENQINLTFNDGFGSNISANVNLLNITIPSQQKTTFGETITYEGDGFINSSQQNIQLNIDYSASIGGFTQSSSTVFTGSK